MASQQNCWAGVVYDKNRKSVVPVHSIKKFDPQNYTPKKYYKIAVDGTSKDCIVLGVRDTKEAVQKEVLSKRSSLPPANLIESASECSDLSELQSKSKNTKNLAPSVKGLNQQILELNQSSAKRQYEKDNAKEKMNPKKQKFDGKNSNPPSQRPSIPPLNKQSDRKIKVQNIQTIPASSMSSGSPKSSKKETYEYINHLKGQLNMNKEEIENYKTKVNELEKENEKLKNDVIGQNIKIIDFLKKHIDTLLSEKTPSKIGQLNEEKDQIYIAEERLMEKGLFESAMSAKRPTLFINTIALFFFDRITLLKSTVTGMKSKRSVEEIQPEKLDPIILRQMRDLYDYYLNNSVYTRRLEDHEKTTEFRNFFYYLSKFIARLKNPSSKNKKKSTSKKNLDGDKRDVNEHDKNENDDNEDTDPNDDDDNTVDNGHGNMEIGYNNTLDHEEERDHLISETDELSEN